jgi:hypothetical protein
MTMSNVLAPEHIRISEFAFNDNEYVIKDYLGAYDEVREGPQAFLVQVTNPHGRIKPHYHEVDQYQVVVGGSGRIGQHALAPGAIHYTDGYTPYGPIFGAEDGIDFFTLRVDSVTGSQYMPESRDKKTVRNGYSFECQADMSLPSESGCRLLAETPNGAQAHELRAAPGEQLPSPRSEALRQPGYYVVLVGELALDGESLAPRGVVFHKGGAPYVQALAGTDGAVVVHLSFPHSHERPTRDMRLQR